MNASDLFPSKWLKASDLKGREPAVCIAGYRLETIGQSQDKKAVLYFQNIKKGLVLNKTNTERIAHCYGDDMDDWVGKEVILYTDTVAFQGKQVEAIRVKGPKVAPAELDDEIVF